MGRAEHSCSPFFFPHHIFCGRGRRQNIFLDEVVDKEDIHLFYFPHHIFCGRGRRHNIFLDEVVDKEGVQLFCFLSSLMKIGALHGYQDDGPRPTAPLFLRPNVAWGPLLGALGFP